MNALSSKSAVIIGGGVMGLGTAFHLAEKGYKVTVLEKADDIATVSETKVPPWLKPKYKGGASMVVWKGLWDGTTLRDFVSLTIDVRITNNDVVATSDINIFTFIVTEVKSHRVEPRLRWPSFVEDPFCVIFYKKWICDG